ncbi:MAG: acyl carrier protein [Sedimentisphaerales bacterium]|nr:acyl carrier protein [Sedimentisphaerales bacterium]
MSTQTTETLARQVIELISSHADIPPKDISLDSYFIADLGFDSLAIVEFVMLVEDEFNISVSDEDNETIKTVRDAVVLIQKLISSQR